MENATGDDDSTDMNDDDTKVSGGRRQLHVGTMYTMACLAAAGYGPLVAQAPGMPCMVTLEHAQGLCAAPNATQHGSEGV